MARVEIENTKLVRNEAKTKIASVALDATDGAMVDYTQKSDGRILLMLENSASEAKTATIKQGNALQGVEDLEIELLANETKAIVVESGKFVNVTGENKGKVVITGEATIKVAAIELP